MNYWGEEYIGLPLGPEIIVLLPCSGYQIIIQAKKRRSGNTDAQWRIKWTSVPLACFIFENQVFGL